jgi:hypothetical protein
MGSIEGGSLLPELDEAQRALMQALEEACAVDIEKANTGELIRIEEQLNTASKAAKEAVSIRLRQRSEGPKPDSEPARLGEALRVFDDPQGKRWRVFAVHPSAATTEKKSLPERYRSGWLAFESADEMRRAAPIPPDWTGLSIEGLRTVWNKAESAPKRVNRINVPDLPVGRIKP